MVNCQLDDKHFKCNRQLPKATIPSSVVNTNEGVDVNKIADAWFSAFNGGKQYRTGIKPSPQKRSGDIDGYLDLMLLACI